MADVLTDIASLQAPGPVTGTVAAAAEQEAQSYFSLGRKAGTAKMMTGRMPELVKGAGFVGPGGNKPLDNFTDINQRAAEATLKLRAETFTGFHNKAATIGSLNQNWLNDFGALKTAMLQMSPMDYVNSVVSYLPGGSEAVKAAIEKSFTAGNLGIGSVSS